MYEYARENQKNEEEIVRMPNLYALKIVILQVLVGSLTIFPLICVTTMVLSCRTMLR